MTGLRRDRPQPGGAEGMFRLAEVDVEILEFGAPAAADGSLDARAGGPSGLHILEGCGERPDAGRGDNRVVLDLTVCDAGRAKEQDVRGHQDA